MFSLEAFYKILYLNLLKPVGANAYYFTTFGSTDARDLRPIDYFDLPESATNNQTVLETCYGTVSSESGLKFALFYDQEPIYETAINRLWTDNPAEFDNTWHHTTTMYHLPWHRSTASGHLLANSEYSDTKDQFIKNTTGYYDWYYFFHGFAALDWYRNVRYQPPIRKYSKVFISFNYLFTEKRSYRLNLIARLKEANILDHGFVSLDPTDVEQRIKQEVFSPHSELSQDSKKVILKTLLPTTPTLVVDDYSHGRMLSANDDLETISQGLFHIVTETVFYDKKLHLTEKIFKPIVARRPFFLAAAPGNLAYLKSYGFKTFNRWIDESYDLEQDNDQRIIKIINEVNRLCRLNPTELDSIYSEMQEILDYNFNWFYTGFKQQISEELVDNFRRCLININAGINNPQNQLPYQHIDFEEVKKRLAQ